MFQKSKFKSFGAGLKQTVAAVDTAIDHADKTCRLIYKHIELVALSIFI